MAIDKRRRAELKREELFSETPSQNLFTYFKDHEEFKIPRSVDRNTLEKNRTRAKNALVRKSQIRVLLHISNLRAFFFSTPFDQFSTHFVTLPILGTTL